MKTVTSLAGTFLVMLAASASAQAADCVGLDDIVQVAPAEDKGLWARFMSGLDVAKQDECASLTTVVDKVLNRKRTGGRKLEDDKPLDVVAAEANLQQALDDPAIRKRFDELRTQIPDEGARMLYEAAILDSEGYYDARELRIRQLREKLHTRG